MPQRLHLPCKVRYLRLKPRGCDRALAFPVILKVHDRNHAAQPDRAFDGGALSARYFAKRGHDFADVG
jgi:hypothetical protein